MNTVRVTYLKETDHTAEMSQRHCLKFQNSCLVEGIWVSLLFVLYPLLSLPILLQRLWVGRRYARTFLALFLALCSIYYPPVSDQFQYHVFVTEVFPTMFWSTYWESIVSFKQINPVMMFFWLGAQYDSSLEIMRFFFVLGGFWTAFQVLDHIFEQHPACYGDSSVRFYATVAVLCTVPYFPMVWGIRQGLASILVAGGIYFLCIGDAHYIKGSLFLALGSLVHFSLSPLLLLIPVVRLAPLPSLRKIFCWPVLLLLTIGSVYYLNWLAALPWFEEVFGSSLQEQYLDASNIYHLSGARNITLIQHIFYFYPFIFCLYLIYLFYQVAAFSKLSSNAMIVVLLYSCLFMRDFFLRYRISMLLAPLFLFYLLATYGQSRIPREKLQLIALLSFLIFFIGNFLHCFQPFLSSELYQVIHSSIFQILSHRYTL